MDSDLSSRISAPKCTQFADLLRVPNQSDASIKKINLFAFGSLIDLDKMDIELSVSEKAKLAQLTILDYISNFKKVELSSISSHCGLPTSVIEDILISAIDLGLVQGSLSHRDNSVSVHTVVARDVKDIELPWMLDVLNQFKSRAKRLVNSIDSSADQVAADSIISSLVKPSIQCHPADFSESSPKKLNNPSKSTIDLDLY